MSEEMIKGLKQFRREDLITSPYEYDIDDNCEVFMRIREMIEYSNLQQENNQLKDKINKAVEYLNEWGKEPDADMYMFIRDYKEFKHLLSLLKGDKE